MDMSIRIRLRAMHKSNTQTVLFQEPEFAQFEALQERSCNFELFHRIEFPDAKAKALEDWPDRLHL